jgi:hypothetical protein
MFESVSADQIRGMTTVLAAPALSDTDADRVAEIRALEELKSAAEARQAALTAGLTENRATAAEVALARRESHHRGRQHLALARIAPRELPHAWAAWRAGRVSEWRVTILARETACLSLEHRLTIDAEVARDPSRFEGMGDRDLVGYCRERAASLDAAAVVRRRRRAESERRVTLRPAPDAMVHLSALLPVAEGVAAFAALTRAADTARSQGDTRGRGQVMADTLATSLLGCQPGRRTTPAVTLDVVLTDRALFGGADHAAHLDGYGAIDAELARELAHGDRVWFRRALADPATGELVALETRARRFRDGLRRLVRLRDRWCRTPWCDAPVRHVDHPDPAARGGPSNDTNSQGLCEACNQAKETTGWCARPRPGPGHRVDTTTPAGQRHTTRAPALAGHRPRRSPLELHWSDVLLAA